MGKRTRKVFNIKFYLKFVLQTLHVLLTEYVGRAPFIVMLNLRGHIKGEANEISHVQQGKYILKMGEA